MNPVSFLGSRGMILEAWKVGQCNMLMQKFVQLFLFSWCHLTLGCAKYLTDPLHLDFWL
jgi:hypothetical protein